MNELPLVSIIIPCFNSERWIADTLASVFKQSYQRIEVIIVDDGSTDNTKEIVLNQRNEVYYYYQHNQGPSAARNLGIKKAKGEYIAFLDSDDLWEEDKLYTQVQYLEENKDVHLVFSNVKLINEEGDPLYTHYNQVPHEKKEIIIKFFKSEITMNTPTIVARKKSVLNINGFDEDLPLREDHFFLMTMVSKYKVFHFKEPLVSRRVTRQSMSNTINVEKLFDLNEPFISKSQKTFPYLKKYSKNIYSRLYLTKGRGYWRNGDYSKSLKNILKAIYFKPKGLKNYVFFVLIILRFKHSNIENVKWKYKIK